MVVVDLHASIPEFPSDDVGSGGQPEHEPCRAAGARARRADRLHLYPLNTRIVTFGLGGELVDRPRAADAGGRRHRLRVASRCAPSEERITSLSPQLSLNFGNGSGWSYLSAGLGADDMVARHRRICVDYPPNSDRLKTLNYGGGARWFIKPHLAFSFDVRFYAISPGFAYIFDASPAHDAADHRRRHLNQVGRSLLRPCAGCVLAIEGPSKLGPTRL